MTLLERVQAATGGSRELDLDVWNFFSSELPWSFTSLGSITCDRYGPGAAGNPVVSLTEFTTTLDGAVDLLEYAKPGWFWRAGHIPSTHWHNGRGYDHWCHISRTDASNCDREDEATGWANSVPLAIIAALLLAHNGSHK